MVRGACIASMVIAHIAATSLMYKISHALIWVDGSMGFVFLSGLLLGMVHRRRSDRGAPFRDTAASVGRRIALLWLLNLVLTLIALTLGTFWPSRADLPSFEQHGVIGSVLRASVLMLNPPLSILAMYVVFMAGALGALWILRKGHAVVLLLISGGLYGAWGAFGFDSSLPGQGSDQAFQLAAWQFLFFLGLVLGWYWKQLDIRTKVLTSRVVTPAIFVVVALALLAHLTVRARVFATTDVEHILRSFFNKLALGPGAIVFALAAIIVAYKIANVLPVRATWLLRPVTRIGKRSLDSYVISTVAAMALPALLSYRVDSTWAEALAIATLILCYFWARHRASTPSGAHGNVFFKRAGTPT